MKPKYNFLKNTFYALSGLQDAIKNETSFKIELICVAILWVCLIFVPIELHFKMILALSLFIVLLAELINSAIELVVDLVTQEYHELAKRAKDMGSAVVFMSITLTSLIWLCVIVLITLKYIS